MGSEDGDITALRRELTQELGQDDLVEEPDGTGPPNPPPSLFQQSVSNAPPRTAADRMRRAREWVDECERELRGQPDVRRAARLYFEMARTCETPLKDTRRALQYYQASLERAPDYIPAIRATRRLLLGARMFRQGDSLFVERAPT